MVNKYNLKFKKLDILFASDIVVDGSDDIIGPFQTAQTHSITKESFPYASEDTERQTKTSIKFSNN